MLRATIDDATGVAAASEHTVSEREVSKQPSSCIGAQSRSFNEEARQSRAHNADPPAHLTV